MEEVTWNDLACVEIVTTDEGPFVEDVFWLFLAKDHGCALPGRLGSEILAHLDRLPGYDAQAVIRAMGSTENARFRVWTRDDSRDAPRTDAKD